MEMGPLSWLWKSVGGFVLICSGALCALSASASLNLCATFIIKGLFRAVCSCKRIWLHRELWITKEKQAIAFTLVNKLLMIITVSLAYPVSLWPAGLVDVSAWCWWILLPVQCRLWVILCWFVMTALLRIFCFNLTVFCFRTIHTHSTRDLMFQTLSKGEDELP